MDLLDVSEPRSGDTGKGRTRSRDRPAHLRHHSDGCRRLGFGPRRPAAIGEPIDVVVMNAGVIGNKKLMNLTADGVTTLFATNVLGHVVLLDGLLHEK